MKLFKLLLYFWTFLREYKRFLIIPVLFAFVLALQESLSPYLIKVIIDSIALAQTSGDWKLIYMVGFLYVVAIEIVNILFRLRDYFKLKVFPKVKAKLISHMYETFLGYNYEFHLNQCSGGLANKISDMVKGIETIFNMIVDVFLWRVLSLVFATFTMYLAQPLLSGILIAWCFLFVSLTLYMSRKTHCEAVNFSSSRNDLYGQISDGLSNILNIILYQSHRFEKLFLNKQLTQYQLKEEKLLKIALLIGFSQGLMVTLFTGIVTAVLIYSCQKQLITLGQFSLVMILSVNIIRNIYSISSDLVRFSKELGACTQALITLETFSKQEINVHKDWLKISTGNIRFNNVSYAYSDHRIVFNNLNFNIQGKEKIGIVGISGSGKTTLINLLMKLFDCHSGDILIDDQNIDNVFTESLREAISILPQEPILFNRSIYENINYGSEHFSLNEVIDAAKRAHCHDFIMQLNESYNTLVGERGVKLSGGQKQRIALARAILKNAPIVILDEPTSALDSLTEALIQDSLTKLLDSKTVIIIAHRLSTLKNLDRIIVFHQGKIHEQGKHDELIRQNGLYRQLWQEQNLSIIESINS